MTKLTKDELITRISNLNIDEDVQISLMEDISDSMETPEISAEEKVKIENYDDLKFKYDDLKAKYKERFLNTDIVADTVEVNDDVKELEEKEVIDIKEI